MRFDRSHINLHVPTCIVEKCCYKVYGGCTVRHHQFPRPGAGSTLTLLIQPRNYPEVLITERGILTPFDPLSLKKKRAAKCKSLAAL